MPSPLPRLYRSLEKSGPESGFDAIAMAAALSFATVANPRSKQTETLQKLIEPLWDRLSDETRSEIAHLLQAHKASLPAALAQEIGETARRHPKPAGASVRTTAPSQTKAPEPAASNRPPRHAASTEEARRALRQLAGNPPAGDSTFAPLRDTNDGSMVQKRLGDRLVAFARMGDRAGLRAGLSRELALPPAAIDRLFEGSAMVHLAPALKALGLSTPDALTILMFVDHSIAANVATFAKAKADYDALSSEASMAAYAPRERMKVDAPALQPLSADLLTPLRGAPSRRAAFGRRQDHDRRGTGTRD
ncbi:MAG: hypothetical protein VYD57_14390 [Pseudomonadota bacterium]|nr:hypothetical protein [Pseudomonadota bacterium]